ncbi:MAG: hypothetical protein ABIE42_01575 [Candidatus Eisenbacteria bacterium]
MRTRHLSHAVLALVSAVLLTASVGGTYAVAQDTTLEVDITIAPKTLSIDSEASCDEGGVTVHADIPYSDVDHSTLALEGVPVLSTKPDGRGNLVAQFDRAEILPLVAPPSATLTLTGAKVDGTPIAGSYTISVVDPI